MKIDTMLHTLCDLSNLDTLPAEQRDALWRAMLTLATLSRKHKLKGTDDEMRLFEVARND